MADHTITLTERQEAGLDYAIAKGSTLEGSVAALCEGWASEADQAKYADYETYKKVALTDAVKQAVDAELAKVEAEKE